MGISGGVLVYTARVGDQNQITVTGSGSDYIVTDAVPIDDTNPPGGCTVSGNMATCPASGISRIRIDARDLSDVIAIGSGIDIPVSVIGGAGVDTVDYSSGSGGGVDVNLSAGTASRGGGTDKLTTIESVTGTNSDDHIDVRDGIAGTVICNGGNDSVVGDTIDAVSSDCEESKLDNHSPPETTITAGPANPTNASTVSFEFSSNEPGSTFACELNGSALGTCASPQSIADLTEGNYAFSVAAIDPFDNRDLTPATWPFTIDRSPPTTSIDGGPEENSTITDNTPTFEFSSEPQTTFECQIDDGVYTSCESPFSTPELGNGLHKFTVRAKDQAGNVDMVGASRSFTVDASVPPPPPPPSGDGGSSPAPVPQANAANTVIFGSLVLISGRSVKLMKGKLVPVRLTCSGPRTCSGRLTVTSDSPVKKSKKKKKSKRLERLGSTRFTIDGNHDAQVLVPLSRTKVRLIKKLKRLKARATIREIDVQGHPRISTRTFLLRAR